jgi:hypothetical protein
MSNILSYFNKLFSLHSEDTKLGITRLDLIPASHRSLQTEAEVSSCMLGRDNSIILSQVSFHAFMNVFAVDSPII